MKANLYQHLIKKCLTLNCFYSGSFETLRKSLLSGSRRNTTLMLMDLSTESTGARASALMILIILLSAKTRQLNLHLSNQVLHQKYI